MMNYKCKWHCSAPGYYYGVLLMVRPLSSSKRASQRMRCKECTKRMLQHMQALMFNQYACSHLVPVQQLWHLQRWGVGWKEGFESDGLHGGRLRGNHVLELLSLCRSGQDV